MLSNNLSKLPGSQETQLSRGMQVHSEATRVGFESQQCNICTCGCSEIQFACPLLHVFFHAQVSLLVSHLPIIYYTCEFLVTVKYLTVTCDFTCASAHAKFIQSIWQILVKKQYIRYHLSGLYTLD